MDLGELLDPKSVRLINHLAVRASHFSWALSIKVTVGIRVPLQTSLRMGMWRTIHDWLTWKDGYGTR